MRLTYTQGLIRFWNCAGLLEWGVDCGELPLTAFILRQFLPCHLGLPWPPHSTCVSHAILATLIGAKIFCEYITIIIIFFSCSLKMFFNFLTLCLLCNFAHAFLSSADVFQNHLFYLKLYQEYRYHQSVKHFGSMFCLA